MEATDGPFRLLDLPLDIFGLFLAQLVPRRPATGTNFPLPIDISAAREALRKLCLVSKFFWGLALPLLYTNVVITDYVQMTSLLANLAVYEERRGWICSFAMIAEFPPVLFQFNATWKTSEFQMLVRTINWFEKMYEMRRPQGHAFDTFQEVGAVLYQLLDMNMDMPTNEDGVLGLDRWRQFRFELYSVYTHILQRVLGMQTKVEDILILQSPFPLNLSPTDSLRRFYQSYLQDPSQTSIGDHFKSLQSIRKQVNLNKVFTLTPDPIQPEFIMSKKWEFFGDNGGWFSPIYGNHLIAPFTAEREQGIFSKILELGLYESRTHPALLREILRSCNELQKLVYTTNPMDWEGRSYSPVWPWDDSDENPVTTLQEAINEVRDTLKHLHLGWRYSGAEMTEEEEAAVAPHRVNVTGFPLLEEAQIDPPFRQSGEQER